MLQLSLKNIHSSYIKLIIIGFTILKTFEDLAKYVKTKFQIPSSTPFSIIYKYSRNISRDLKATCALLDLLLPFSVAHVTIFSVRESNAVTEDGSNRTAPRVVVGSVTRPR